MRIYLDVCALNRPFDDQTQDRIHLESEAVLAILARSMDEPEWIVLGSDTVDYEISKIPDPLKRHKVMFLAGYAGERVVMEEAIGARAKELQSLGFAPLDSLHLACAEKGNAHIFLTTDDSVLKKSSRHGKKLKTQVKNPLPWLMEKMK